MIAETLERAILGRFGEAISDRLGLRFEDGRLNYLAEVLRERVEGSGVGQLEQYLTRLTSSTDWEDEWKVLAEQLTVTETYFFRYWDHFRAFAEIGVPERVRARSSSRELRILSAGCASGEEAYSIAILLRDRLGEGLGQCPVKITGIDINPTMIEKARRGRYSAWSLRETPKDFRDRNFKADGRDLILDSSVRAMVTFERINLLDHDPKLWQPNSWDIVFFRNVCMYFVPKALRDVVRRISNSLIPGGYLFLGHAENLRGVSDEFELRHTHETFYYQKKQTIAPPGGAPAGELESFDALGPTTSAMIPTSNAVWVDSIQRASDRIATLISGAPKSLASGTRRPPHTESPAPTPTQRSPWSLGSAEELLRKERFAAALDLLRGLPPETDKDPDVLLLSAVILTNSGDLSSAAEACKALLASDDLNAGAHYLMALCCEHAGNRLDAVRHDRTAVGLDPGFAMPRMHLGLLAKRDQNFEAARMELVQALRLLKQEAAPRILLFGGGFSREALMEICRNALSLCGVSA